MDNTITSDPVTPTIGDPIQFTSKPRATGTAGSASSSRPTPAPYPARARTVRRRR